MVKVISITKNRNFILVFRAAAFLLAAWGVLNTVGVFRGTIVPVTLLAYTVQSNIWAALLFLVLFVKTLVAPSGRSTYGFFPRISMVISSAIFITMLVFWAVLIPTATQLSAEYILSFNNLTIHLFVPLLVIADTLLFAKRGKLKRFDYLFALVIPYIYIAQTLTLGLTRSVRYDALNIHSYYPYFFLDVDKHGIWVIPMLAGLTVFFLSLAFIWQKIDSRLAKKPAKRK
jgi:hypothetical protein